MCLTVVPDCRVSCKSKFHLVRVTSTRIRFFSITERIS